MAAKDELPQPSVAKTQEVQDNLKYLIGKHVADLKKRESKMLIKLQEEPRRKAKATMTLILKLRCTRHFNYLFKSQIRPPVIENPKRRNQRSITSSASLSFSQRKNNYRRKMTSSLSHNKQSSQRTRSYEARQLTKSSSHLFSLAQPEQCNLRGLLGCMFAVFGFDNVKV